MAFVRTLVLLALVVGVSARPSAIERERRSTTLAKARSEYDLPASAQTQVSGHDQSAAAPSKSEFSGDATRNPRYPSEQEQQQMMREYYAHSMGGPSGQAGPAAMSAEQEHQLRAYQEEQQRQYMAYVAAAHMRAQQDPRMGGLMFPQDPRLQQQIDNNHQLANGTDAADNEKDHKAVLSPASSKKFSESSTYDPRPSLEEIRRIQKRLMQQRMAAEADLSGKYISPEELMKKQIMFKRQLEKNQQALPRSQPQSPYALYGTEELPKQDSQTQDSNGQGPYAVPTQSEIIPMGMFPPQPTYSHMNEMPPNSPPVVPQQSYMMAATLSQSGSASPQMQAAFMQGIPPQMGMAPEMSMTSQFGVYPQMAMTPQMNMASQMGVPPQFSANPETELPSPIGTTPQYPAYEYKDNIAPQGKGNSYEPSANSEMELSPMAPQYPRRGDIAYEARLPQGYEQAGNPTEVELPEKRFKPRVPVQFDEEQHLPGTPNAYPGPIQAPLHEIRGLLSLEYNLQHVRSQLLRSFYADLISFRMITQEMKKRMMLKLAMVHMVESRMAMPIRGTIAMTMGGQPTHMQPLAGQQLDQYQTQPTDLTTTGEQQLPFSQQNFEQQPSFNQQQEFEQPSSDNYFVQPQQQVLMQNSGAAQQSNLQESDKPPFSPYNEAY